MWFRRQRYKVFPTNPNLRQHKTCLKRHEHEDISRLCPLFHPENRFSRQKVWPFQIKAVPLQHENPPSLFTMLKSAGRFILLWHDIPKHIHHQHNWYRCCNHVASMSRMRHGRKTIFVTSVITDSAHISIPY